MGGINKDDVRSSHGSLHQRAADLAVNATMELLEDIRVAVGERNFLRYEPPSPELVLHPCASQKIKTLKNQKEDSNKLSLRC